MTNSSPADAMQEFFASFARVVQARGRSADLSPYQLVDAWRTLAAEVADGFDDDLYDYQDRLSVRDILERAIAEPALEAWPVWQHLLAEIDRVDTVFVAGTVERPQAPPDAAWWHRRLPRRAGVELRQDVEKRYGLHLDETPLSGYVLPTTDLPQGFVYPDLFRRTVDLGLVNWHPWELTRGDELARRSAGIATRYPKRTLVPFARRVDRDDVACWDLDAGGGQVSVIDDFEAPGLEQLRLIDSFADWLRLALAEMIAWED